MLIAVAALTMSASHAGAQQQVRMTVQETLKSNHQIEVVAGTEVVWAAPRFDRVWFPAGSDVLVFKAAPVNETPRAPSRSPLR